MDYDFICDGDLLEELKSSLTEKIEAAKTALDNIYTELGNMGTEAWQGDDYNALMEAANAKKESIYESITNFEKVRDQVDSAITDISTLTSSISSSVG